MMEKENELITFLVPDTKKISLFLIFFLFAYFLLPTVLCKFGQFAGDGSVQVYQKMDSLGYAVGGVAPICNLEILPILLGNILFPYLLAALIFMIFFRKKKTGSRNGK